MSAPRILIVDDEETIRLAYQEELEEAGYAVSAAANAQEAFSMLKQEPVDLLILDIKMPGMNGIDMLQKLVGIGNQVPVIMNSGYTHFRESYLTWLAEAYVVKSTDLEELKRTIRSVLKKSRPERTLKIRSGNVLHVQAKTKIA